MSHEEETPHQEENAPPSSTLRIEAMISELSRKMSLQMEELHGRMDQIEHSQSTSKEKRPKQPTHEYDESHGENEEFGRVSRFARGNPNQGDDTIKGVKLKIPAFQGKSDPEAYLEWEGKIEMVFDCHSYTEEQKVKLATVEFTDYALVWWDQRRTSRRRNGERAISSWAELKGIMRRRFIPSYYHRELHHRLQTLTQGSKSVEDFYKELEILLMRLDLQEDHEATMARFLNGLKPEIAKVVELQHYLDIHDMLDKAIKVERRLKWRGTTRPSSSATWRSNPLPKEEDKSTAPIPSQRPRVDTPQPTVREQRPKGVPPSSSEPSSNRSQIGRAHV